MQIKAYAKINPYLNITGKRNDGYHDLDIVFRPVSLCDILEIEKQDEGLSITCDREDLCGPDNILFKAYELLKKEIKKAPGFKVHITKNIPSGAGMGGGSADAAAFLKAANELYELGLSVNDLINIGAKTGADVPACLMERPALASGIGEKLSPVKAPANIFYIIIKPEVSFSTPKMYAEYDRLGNEIKNTGTSAGIVKAMESGDIKLEMALSENVFEKVIPEKELIENIKQALIKSGAAGALMTGSGSAVFGAFVTEEDRNKALEIIKRDPAIESLSIIKCNSIQ